MGQYRIGIREACVHTKLIYLSPQEEMLSLERKRALLFDRAEKQEEDEAEVEFSHLLDRDTWTIEKIK